MKKTILAVCLGAMPVLAFGAAYEITVQQRDATNSAWLMRIPANPPGTNSGMFWIDGVNKQLKWVVPVGATYDNVNNTLTFTGTQADWNAVSGPASILNRPTIPAAQVQSDWNAVSGMGQILNKPSIPAAQVQTDWNAVSGMGVLLNKPSLSTVASTGAYADLTGKPSLFDGTWGSLSGKPGWTGTFDGSYASLSSIPSSFVPSSHTHPASQINDSTTVGRAVMTAADQEAARSAIGAGTSSFSGAYSSLSGIPSTFAPSAHQHAASDIVSGTLDVARIPALPISQTTNLQTTLNGKFNTPAGTTGQYVRGDGSLATFPAGAVFTGGAPNTRSMSLATAYQCTDNTKPCFFTITLQAQSSISLSGAVNNEGQVLIGATNAVASGTGTAVGFYRNNLGGALVVGLNITSAQANSYSVMVPAGWYIASRQTAGSGLTVVSAFDQAMSN